MRKRAGRTVVALLIVIGAGLGVLVLLDRSGEDGRTARCNGTRALCDRRLDEVVFPATHNSFGASEQAGWRFANQRYGIARQLDFAEFP